MKKTIILGVLLSSLALFGCAHENKNKDTKKESKTEKSSSKQTSSETATSEEKKSDVPEQSASQTDQSTTQPESSTPVAEKDLNVDAIRSGDYTTLVGEWQNGDGETLVINLDGTTNKGFNIKGVQNDPSTKVPYIYYGYNDGPGAKAISSLLLFKIGFSNPDGDQSDQTKPRIVITQNTLNYPAGSYYYRIK